MERNLIWFRSDLRISDNPALAHALETGNPSLALYIHQPAQDLLHHRGRRQLDFIQANLDMLHRELDALDIELLEVTWDDYATTERKLPEFIAQHEVTRLIANREHGVYEHRRDHALRSSLEIPFYRFNADCVLECGSVLNGSGEMFRVFTPFRNRWLRVLQERGYALAASPAAQQSDGTATTESVWPVGEHAAGQQLQEFCQQHLRAYAELRDYPARPATSSLSPYLAVGVLSPLQCLQAIEAELGYLPMSPGEDGFTWLNELIWREFYRHLMDAYPLISMDRSFKADMDKVHWLQADEHFSAWCDGMTGFPIIDAAMRCLSQTGWMHNRLRMIVASFLTKDLQIDWRRGEAYFMQQLIDADFPSNNGGGQWAAGTGADAAPYFRIFNPTRQSEKFDAGGEFIWRWVPELQNVPEKHIHDPHAWLTQHPTEPPYPQPVVDHAQARQETLARYKNAKETS